MRPGNYYRICARANGFENLFYTDANYRFFLSRYENFIPVIAQTFCFCLLPDQARFLVKIRGEREIESVFGQQKTLQSTELRVSKQFANLFSSYTQALNKSINRTGSLFNPNFERDIVKGRNPFIQEVLDIHCSPVALQFVSSPIEWPWSSFYSILEERSFLNSKEVLSRMGGPETYLDLHLNDWVVGS